MTEPHALQVEVQLRNGAAIDTHIVDIPEDAGDDEITEGIQRLLRTHSPGGWIAMGDSIVHVAAIEAITPR